MKTFSKMICKIISLTLTASAAVPIAAYAEEPRERVSYIVETDGTALLEQNAASVFGAEAYLASDAAAEAANDLAVLQEDVVCAITENFDSDAEVGYSYTTVFSGFSIETDSTPEEIMQLPGVKNVYPVYEYKFEDPDEVTDIAIADEEINDPNTVTNIDELHARQITGSGQAVVVIDTELDADHEMFQETPTEPKYTQENISAVVDKINEGRAEDKQMTVAGVYKSEKIPFAYSYAHNRSSVAAASGTVVHGSHVSGIAVGKNGTLPNGDTFSGTAPDAQLIFMGVCSDSGTISTANVIAAINDSVYFDASAINLSLGNDYIYSYTPYKTAIAAVRNAGILVSVSAGNAARGNQFAGETFGYAKHPDSGSLGISSNMTDSYTVASAINATSWNLGEVLTLSDNTEVIYNDTYSFTSSFKDKEYEYVYCGYGYESDFTDKVLTGKIAVIDRGDLTFEDKLKNAKSAGADGVLFVMYDDNIGISINPYTILPFAVIGAGSGASMKALENKTLTVIGTHSGAMINNDLGISEFSTWGPDISLELKPDITGIGSYVYSSVPGGYELKSGTSMSAPQIAGAAALIRQYMSVSGIEKSAAERTAYIENLLASSADPITDSVSNNPYSPRVQGAGLIDLADAITIPVILKGGDGRTKISLYDNIGDTFTIKFTAENISDKEVTYDKIALTVQTDGILTEEDGTNLAYSTAAITHTTGATSPVTIAAGGSAPVSVSVTLNDSSIATLNSYYPNGFFVEGFVTLSDSAGANPDVNIPYMGFYGDWTAAPVFDEPYYSANSVYGRTYLGSGKKCSKNTKEDNCTILGKNPLVSLKGAVLSGDASAYEGSGYAGISPNEDGIYDYLCVPVSPLRTAYKVTVKLTDTNGTVTKTKSRGDSYTDKYYIEHYDFSYSDLSSLAEGDYTITVSGLNPYDNSAATPITMPFYIDKTAPVLTSASLSDGTLTLTAADNRYVAGFVVSDGTNEKVIAAKPSPTAETSVDVSGFDTSKLTVTVYDYAANTTEDALHAKVNGSAAHESPVYVSAEVFNGMYSDGRVNTDDNASLADKITVTPGIYTVKGIDVYLKGADGSDLLKGSTDNTKSADLHSDSTVNISVGSAVIAVILDGTAAENIGIQVIE